MRFNNNLCLRFIQAICILAQLKCGGALADEGKNSLQLNLIDPVSITIKGPLQKLIVEGKADYEKNGKNSVFSVRAVLLLNLLEKTISLPVDLSLRGQSSVSVMDFPKYKIKFKVDNDPIPGPLDNLKVVSHGWETDSDRLVGQGDGIRATPLGVYREAAVYDLLRVAGFPIAQSRRAMITYDYSDLDKKIEQPALLIETYKTLAKRLKGAEIPLKEMTDEVFKTVGKSVWTPRILFAEMMIGNWDFALPTPQDLKVGTHNVTLIRKKDGTIVPYVEDFNMASIVSLKIERPDEVLNSDTLENSPLYQMMNSNIGDLKDEFSSERIKATIEYFLKRKQAMLNKVDSLLVDEKGRTNIRNHLLVFFKILEKQSATP